MADRKIEDGGSIHLLVPVAPARQKIETLRSQANAGVRPDQTS